MKVSAEDKKTNVHEGHRERLREKFLADPELKSFREHEVLEYVLSLVIPRKDTNVLAHELIKKFGSLNAVLTADPRELKQSKNMTQAASYLLAAMYPVVRRALQTQDYVKNLAELKTPEMCADYLFSFFYARKTECLVILYLNVRYQPLFTQLIEGEHSEHIRLDSESITKRAIKEGASYVVLAHNHPSSRLEPSGGDIQETFKLYMMLRGAGMRLNDSMIFHNDGYLSFRRIGIMDRLDCDWLRNEKERQDIKDGTFFDLEYKSHIREYVLDYQKMRDQYEMEAVEYVPPSKRNEDPKKK